MKQAALVLAIAWFLFLPLGDVFTYPDRIAVLPNLQTDAAAYHAIGRELEATRSLDALPPRHPPGWVTLLAALYAITGPSYVPGKVVSWLALIVSVMLSFVLARRVFSPLAGWIAALLCASSPALRGYVGTVQYEVITGTYLLAVVWLALRTAEATTARGLHRRAVLAGVTGAVLILTRETFAVIVPLVAFWMAHRIRAVRDLGTAIVAATIVIATSIAPAVVWSAIQSVRYGGLITISEKGPIVVELGNNPRANGTYNAPLVGIGQPTGLAFVRQYPARTVWLAGRKILYFWGVLRDGWNVPRPSAVWLWRATTGLVPLEVFGAIARGGWLLALFATSIWMLGREGLRQWWVLPATVLGLMAIHIAVLSSHRFAVPILPIVFVLASGPIANVTAVVWRSLRAPVVALSATLLLAVIVAMQYQSWPLEVRYSAVEVDGLDADNIDDRVSGQPVRFADAKRGERPVVLVTDEYLPRGPLRIDVDLRRASEAAAPATEIARILLMHLDGRVACAREVRSAELHTDRFDTVSVQCELVEDNPATLAIYSLGAADFAIAGVHLAWLTGNTTNSPAKEPPAP